MTEEHVDHLLDADAALVAASGQLTRAVAVRTEGRDIGDVGAARDQFEAAQRDYHRALRAALDEEAI